MFKNRIKEIRHSLGLSQSKFADFLNVSSSLVAHWELGSREPTISSLELIADKLGVSVEYLLGREESTPVLTDTTFSIMTFSVPVYGSIPAGVPLEAIEDRMEDIPIPDWLAKKRDLFGLVIKGDSMDRILPDGVVGVFQKTEMLDNGEIGAILVNGYDATVKRFYRLTDAVLLEPQSHNPDHQPTIIKDGDTSVTIIGRLLWYSPVGLVK